MATQFFLLEKETEAVHSSSYEILTLSANI